MSFRNLAKTFHPGADAQASNYSLRHKDVPIFSQSLLLHIYRGYIDRELLHINRGYLEYNEAFQPRYTLNRA